MSDHIDCPHCHERKPLHRCFAGKDGAEIAVHLFVRNCAHKDGYTGDQARCNEVCYECHRKAGDNYFATQEREGDKFYVTQAI